MQSFRYRAVDSRGKHERGRLEARTAREARNLLQERGWWPVEVTPEVSRAGWWTWRGRGPSGEQRVALMRELATLVSTGLSVDDALEALGGQVQGTPRQALHRVRARLQDGHALSVAMQEEPRWFPMQVRAAVAAGEQGGCLDAVLLRLADQLESQQALRRAMGHALVYPMVMGLVSLGIMGVLMVAVVPSMVEVLDDMDVALPWLTQGVLAVAHGVSRYGAGVLVCVVGCVVAGAHWYRHNPGWREAVQRWVLRWPGLGRHLKRWQLGVFCHTCAVLLETGVPVIDAMQCAAGSVGWLPVRRALEGAIESVRVGHSVVHALGQTGLLDSVSLRVIQSGEGRGQLPKMLSKVGDRHLQAVHATWATAVRLFEPMLIVCMGGLVLLVVLAVLWPVLNMSLLVQL